MISLQTAVLPLEKAPLIPALCSPPQRTGAALVEFKSFFPSKTLQKGLPLEVYYSARDRSALFQTRVRCCCSPQH